MRALGISMNATLIRAIEVEASSSRFEVIDYHEKKISDSLSPYQVLSSLILSLPRAPDKIILSLPLNQITFRTLDTPAKDKKEIESTLLYQLEDEIPFDMDDVMFDYSLLSKDGKNSRYHVSVTLKKNIEKLLREIEEFHISPDIITSPAWAYRTVLKQRIKKLDDFILPTMLIKFGELTSQFFVYNEGAPLFFTEIPLGGQHLTQEISQKYQISHLEAEKAKIEHGFILSSDQKNNSEPEQLEFSKTMEEAMLPIINQIKQVILSARTMTSQTIHAIYITGGPSLMPGIRNMIEEKTHIFCDHLKPLSSSNSSGITYSEQTEAFFSLPTALALTATKIDQTRPINFRQKEFAKNNSSHPVLFSQFKYLFYAGALVSILMAIALGAHSYLNGTKMDDLNKQVRIQSEGILGKLSPLQAKKYQSNSTALKNDIKKVIQQKKDLILLFSQDSNSPLDTLKILSEKVSSQAGQELMTFNSGTDTEGSFKKSTPGDSTLVFKLPQAQLSEKIKKELASLYENVTVSSPKPIKNAEGKDAFEVTFSGTLKVRTP